MNGLFGSEKQEGILFLLYILDLSWLYMSCMERTRSDVCSGSTRLVYEAGFCTGLIYTPLCVELAICPRLSTKVLAADKGARDLVTGYSCNISSHGPESNFIPTVTERLLG